jgi:hypothetical protein
VKNEKSIQVVVGGVLGKRTFGRDRQKWEDNIEIDLKESECEKLDWIFLRTFEFLWGHGNEVL